MSAGQHDGQGFPDGHVDDLASCQTRQSRRGELGSAIGSGDDRGIDHGDDDAHRDQSQHGQHVVLGVFVLVVDVVVSPLFEAGDRHLGGPVGGRVDG